MANPIHPKTIKKMISYYYLVSFCPPDQIEALEQSSKNLRTRLAEEAGVSLEEFPELVVPEVARRMVAFQQATREPEAEAVEALYQRMKGADSSPEAAIDFQEILEEITTHPGRAKPANRLHRQKGCDFCEAPCRFGFFTLMADPDFNILQALLDTENKSVADERNVVFLIWVYAQLQIWNVLETQDGMIRADDLGSLSYCLLLLGTAKSRFSLPEKQLKMFLEMNRRTIESLPFPAIRLYEPG